jgi:Xaa-Pro aminopeptidase
VLILTTEHAEHRCVIFVRKRDKDREIWDGPRAGVEGAKEWLGADAAYPIGELSERLPEYLSDVRRLHYRLAVNPEFDQIVFAAIDAVRRKVRTGVVAPSEIVDLTRDLHEMRLRKSAAEIETMAKAAAISHEAHARAMHVARPGAYEFGSRPRSCACSARAGPSVRPTAASSARARTRPSFTTAATIGRCRPATCC